MSGWIKLHRSLLSWEWYDDMPTKCLFFHFLLSANHSPSKWRGIAINRGQLWTSIGNLAKASGMTHKQVRIAIEKLEKTGEIKSEGASNGTMITVCKYDSYQNFDETEGKQRGKGGAKEGQGRGKVGATNNKNKKDNNDEEEEVKSAVAPYFEDSQLNDLYFDYLKMRVEKGKKATPTTIAAQVKKFFAMPRDHVIWGLNQSIENGWTGCWPEKYDSAHASNNAKQTAAASQKPIRPWDNPNWNPNQEH